MVIKVAVVGAGIYGASISSRLAEQGYHVTNFDPLGILRGASSINQYRVHSGYHYPRSSETIREIQESVHEFRAVYAPALRSARGHYYAIPRYESRISPEGFEASILQANLPLRYCKPAWMNFEFIERCYSVDEQLFDPDILRSLLEDKYKRARVNFQQQAFSPADKPLFDFIVYATYGLNESRMLFDHVMVQVAEKVIIQLPEHLRNISLVVIDGPFTAFDPIAMSDLSMFGSAQHTNHWSSLDPHEIMPAKFKNLLNLPNAVPVTFTKFSELLHDCRKVVPSVEGTRYLGSRFTLRVVEHNPREDRRILKIKVVDDREIHVFSGKVVCAIKAARQVSDIIARA